MGIINIFPCPVKKVSIRNHETSSHQSQNSARVKIVPISHSFENIWTLIKYLGTLNIFPCQIKKLSRKNHKTSLQQSQNSAKTFETYIEAIVLQFLKILLTTWET